MGKSLRDNSYQSNEEKQMKGGVINFIMSLKYSNIAEVSTVEKSIQA